MSRQSGKNDQFISSFFPFQDMLTESFVDVRGFSPPVLPYSESGLDIVTAPNRIPEKQVEHWMGQVASFVHAHNEQYPGTMYERSVDQLSNLFRMGHGLTLLHEGDAAYFGLMLPQFSDAQQTLLGGVQVVELANSIVNPDMRSGGIAKLGLHARLSHIRQKWGEDSVAFLTTENKLIARAYKGGSGGSALMEPADWSDNPYLAGMSCVYSATGADTSHACDTKRRPREEADREHFETMYQVAGDEILMPCTLFVSSAQSARRFDATVRQLHGELGGEPVVVAPDKSITTGDILRVDAFYQSLAYHAEQRT